jgi:RNA polymerase sigma factor (sigma-70 family)
MSDVALHSVLGQLRRLAAPQGVGALTDARLLRRIVEARDEAAFEVVVWRHGPLVLGACRKLLRHAQDAEDAFQATFLVLARKAGSIGQGESLPGWLHRVACRVAGRLRSQRHKRLARARQDVDLSAVPAVTEDDAGLEQRELWAAVLEEVERLPARYRRAVVACYLQGKTHAQAARELCRPPGSMSGCLARGRELLRSRLARRGVGLSAAALAALLTERATAALSVPQVLAAVTAALEFAAGTLTATPAAVLARGAMQGMLLSKLNTAAGIVLLVGLLAGGTAGLAPQALTQPPPAQKAPEPVTVQPGRADEPRGRLDRHGDPLPAEAVARLGTTRFRHGGYVFQVAFTPDGKRIITQGWDGICVWDVGTGKELRRRPNGTEGFVQFTAVSPDGKVVAVLRANSPPNNPGVHLLDLATLEEVRSFGKAAYSAVYFSPDGKLLATLAPEGVVELWDVAKGEQRSSWTAHKGSVGAAVFLPDSRTLVTGGGDRQLRFWDVASGEQKREVLAETGQPQPYPTVAILAVSPDGKLLASVNGEGDTRSDNRIRLWETATGKEVPSVIVPGKPRPARQSGAQDVAFGLGGKVLVAVGVDGVPSVFELATGKELRRLSPETGPASRLALLPVRAEYSRMALSPDGKTAAVVVGRGTLCLTDVATGKQSTTAGGHHHDVHDVFFTPDGKTVVTVGGDSDIFVWDAETGAERRRLRGLEDNAQRAWMTGDGRSVFATGMDNSLRGWDVSTGRALKLADVWAREGNDVRAVSPDGRLVVRAQGQDLVIRETATGKEVRALKGDGTYVVGAAFLPGGRFLAAWCRDHAAQVWDLETGREIGALRPQDDQGGRHPGEVKKRARVLSHVPFLTAVSPDGRLIAFASHLTFASAEDGEERSHVVIKELRTGREVLRLRTNLPRPATACAFSADGRTFAYAQGQMIRLVELATGGERHHLSGHRGDIRELCFSADGTRLLSGSDDTTALVWDLTGRLGARSTTLSPEALDGCWKALAESDAAQGYSAVRQMTADPAHSIPFLRAHLRPVESADEKRLAKLIADLDSDEFAVREKAATELGKLGETAAAACRKALAGQPSAEVRRVLGRLLDEWTRQEYSPTLEQLRALRALEVLEMAGTGEARDVLATLAKGAAGAYVTEQAKAALARLAR